MYDRLSQTVAQSAERDALTAFISYSQKVARLAKRQHARTPEISRPLCAAASRCKCEENWLGGSWWPTDATAELLRTICRTILTLPSVRSPGLRFGTAQNGLRGRWPPVTRLDFQRRQKENRLGCLRDSRGTMLDADGFTRFAPPLCNLGA